MSSLSEQIRGYLLGGQPIKRQDRKAGQTQYYYINPGQENVSASDLQTTDIPDEMMNPDGTMKIAGPLNNVQKYNQEVMNNTNQQQVQTQNDSLITEISNVYDTVKNVYDNVRGIYNSAQNTYNNIKQDYFAPRDYTNRYKQGCTPANIAYNTISNYQISPGTQYVQTGNGLVDFGLNTTIGFAASKIPGYGKYKKGHDTIGNGIANIQNAINEAGCFK